MYNNVIINLQINLFLILLFENNIETVGLASNSILLVSDSSYIPTYVIDKIGAVYAYVELCKYKDQNKTDT